MSSSLRYSLMTDGSSDQILRYVIDWLLDELGAYSFNGIWVRSSAELQGAGLSQKITTAMEMYPCDLLFVHRDAEATDPALRYQEVRGALEQLPKPPPVVCIVPIRMTEAWFLCDLAAIRRAASNPNGKVPLSLPRVRSLEKLPDPKSTMFDLLRLASGQSKRRLKRFRVESARRRLGELTRDFSPLEGLSAFQRFRSDLAEILKSHDWLDPSVRPNAPQETR